MVNIPYMIHLFGAPSWLLRGVSGSLTAACCIHHFQSNQDLILFVQLLTVCKLEWHTYWQFPKYNTFTFSPISHCFN